MKIAGNGTWVWALCVGSGWVLGAAAPVFGDIIYVDADATGNNNGSSWQDAYNYLQDALAVGQPEDEIWVAEGTYKPDQGAGITPGDRSATFQLLNGVALYGGYAGDGGPNPDAREIVIHKTILSGDLAGDDGPDWASHLENSYHVVTGSGCNETAVVDGFTISGGNANGSYLRWWGGGMLNLGGSPTVVRCTFTENLANGPFDNWGWLRGAGGGMYNFGPSSPTLIECSFIGNRAVHSAGGGMVNNSYSSPTLTNCVFNGNAAVSWDFGYGGGIFNFDHSSPALTGCTFTDNSADWGGGGMFNQDYSSPTLIDCTFRGNSANFYDGDGGGMLNYNGSSPTLTGCTFRANTAEFGGGICNVYYSNPALTACSFRENSARERGGGIDNFSSSPMLTACMFRENSARKRGGGMHNFSGSPALTNCTFTMNVANNYGGGMWAGDSAVVTNCVFVGNSAGLGGGGIGVSESPTLANCTFNGNSADFAGGGVYCAGGNPMLANCTFAANRAPNGKAVACDSYQQQDPSSVQMNNCILWDSGGEVWNNDGSTIAMTYSNVEGGWPGSGNISVDPLFLDLDGPDDAIGTEDDNLRLLPGSPCVDAGDNGGVPFDALDLDGDGDVSEPIPFDLDRNPRFVDDPCTQDTGQPDPDYPDLGIVDMGAYEGPELAGADADGDGVDNCLDNCPAHPNPDQGDCDDDGVGDVCALAFGISRDCNNGIPDECDIVSGTSGDSNGNGVPDECEVPPWVVAVDAAALAGGDGLSWFTAYNDLQDALDAVAALGCCESGGCEIWVATGAYTPDRGSGDREETFQLLNCVAIYGGFAGWETDPEQRDPRANVTTLAGDLDGDDGPDFLNNGENSYHVVTGSGTDATAILDGFVIAGGNANATGGHGRGGGILNVASSPTVVNCTITGSRARFGAGIHNINNSAPLLVNCTFLGNSATNGGGAMRNASSDPTLVNCAFSGNVAGYGGAVSNNYSSPTLANCTFSGNSAPGGDGGGIHNSNSSSMLRNSILWGNNDAAGTDESAQIYNMSGTPTVSFSCVQGWTGAMGGTGNMGNNPLFVDADGVDNILGTGDDDLRLLPDSSCIDGGSNGAVPADVLDLNDNGDTDEPFPFDLDGNLRFVDDPSTADCPQPGADCGAPPIVDMGAHEHQPDCNNNGVPDRQDIASGTSQDCNTNAIPDECDIAMGTSNDGNSNGTPDECEPRLDIKPGLCPNPLNRNSHGVLPAALLGTTHFDATAVDVASVRLSRADGVGGEVAPNEGPPGPHSVFEDVGTPFAGQPCDCRELEGDGIIDLFMKFRTDDLVETLELNDLPLGGWVELVVTGRLLDGTPCTASDCVRLVPPGTPGANVLFSSTVGSVISSGSVSSVVEGACPSWGITSSRVPPTSAESPSATGGHAAAHAGD